MRTLLCLLLVSAWCASPALGQRGNLTCGGTDHYRWAQKTDTSLASRAPIAIELDTIVNTWVAPNLPANDLCAPRQGNELKTYTVVAWVRLLRAEADSDWHIELTTTAVAPIASCMIAEIPAIRYGSAFARARNQLTQALSASQVAASGIVTPAVRLRFVGAAFYDGAHATHRTHGHCNQQPGGLWELHPVFSVQSP
ncbi:MAG TPA: hypothetical protein VM716_10715 [Gemmatimonadales bacterium]|nr:hypothetical protein [Gemmatimonadales bacterium]